MTNNQIYKLADDRLWDIAQAKWVEEIPAGYEVTDLHRADGPADEAYLIRALKFRGSPLGELATKCPQAIREQLARLDAQYLTPRVLAGMATNDEYAMTQWQTHEELALPLRERLAELTDADNQSL